MKSTPCQYLFFSQVYYFNGWLGRGLVYNDKRAHIADKAQGIQQGFGEVYVWARPLEVVDDLGEAKDRGDQGTAELRQKIPYASKETSGRLPAGE